MIVEFLNKYHNEAYEDARNALKAENEDLGRAAITQNIIDQNIKQSNLIVLLTASSN